MPQPRRYVDVACCTTLQVIRNTSRPARPHIVRRLHSSGFHSRLGFPLNSSVRMRITHGGLQGRVLTASGTRAFSMLFKDSTRENQVSTEIEFLLANVEADLIDLVKRLAEPLFLIFNFGHFEHQIYEQIITDFVAGKVT